MNSFFHDVVNSTKMFNKSSRPDECSHIITSNNSLTLKFLKKVHVNTTPDFFNFYYSVFFKFLEKKINKRILVNFRNRMLLKDKKSTRFKINKFFRRFFYIQRRMGKGFFIKEMIEIFYLSFLFKDILLITNWISRTFYRLHFRQHKKFVSVIKYLINSLFDFFITSNKIRGFFYDLRGKVGVRGNSRKRHVFISVGKKTRTTKKYRYCYDFRIIRTDTGCMGMHTLMVY